MEASQPKTPEPVYLSRPNLSFAHKLYQQAQTRQ
jgi:hypothetical protein